MAHQLTVQEVDHLLKHGQDFLDRIRGQFRDVALRRRVELELPPHRCAAPVEQCPDLRVAGRAKGSSRQGLRLEAALTKLREDP